MDALNFVLIARVLLGFMFAFLAVNNLVHHQKIIDSMRLRRIQFAALGFYSMTVIQFVAGVCLVLGLNIRGVSALLILLVVATTLLLNDFGNAKGSSSHAKVIHLVSNLGAISALLLLFNYY